MPYFAGQLEHNKVNVKDKSLCKTLIPFSSKSRVHLMYYGQKIFGIQLPWDNIISFAFLAYIAKYFAWTQHGMGPGSKSHCSNENTLKISGSPFVSENSGNTNLEKVGVVKALGPKFPPFGKNSKEAKIPLYWQLFIP